MIRALRLASVLAALVVAPPLLAAEAVTVPAWTSPVGSVWTVRTTTVMTTAFDGSGAAPAETRTDRLELAHREQLVERGKDRAREVWTLDLEGGAVRVPPISQEPADPHEAYRRSMAMWGVALLEIETDATGAPLHLLGKEAIRKRVEEVLRGLVPPGGQAPSAPPPIVAAFDAHPEMLIDLLLPEARALAALQTAKPQTTTVGASWTREGPDRVAGVALSKKTVFTVEAVDPAARTVTVSWRDDFEPEALTKAFAALIEANLAAVRAKSGEVDEARRKALSTVAIANRGQIVVSLDDGATRVTEYTRTGRFGDLTTSLSTRIERRAP